MSSISSLFPDTTLPSNIEVVLLEDMGDLLAHAGKGGLLGFAGHSTFGSAFKQGGRVMFTASAPLAALIEMAEYPAGAQEVQRAGGRGPLQPAAGEGTLRPAGEIPALDGLREREVHPARLHLQLRCADKGGCAEHQAAHLRADRPHRGRQQLSRRADPAQGRASRHDRWRPPRRQDRRDRAEGSRRGHRRQFARQFGRLHCRLRIPHPRTAIKISPTARKPSRSPSRWWRPTTCATSAMR